MRVLSMPGCLVCEHCRLRAGLSVFLPCMPTRRGCPATVHSAARPSHSVCSLNSWPGAPARARPSWQRGAARIPASALSRDAPVRYAYTGRFHQRSWQVRCVAGHRPRSA